MGKSTVLNAFLFCNLEEKPENMVFKTSVSMIFEKAKAGFDLKKENKIIRR
jgi:hypothetical protein